MGIPAIVASVITLVLILFLFKPSQPVTINLQEIEEKQKAQGPMSSLEKRTAIWLIIAIILWMTDSIHGIDIGWVTMGVAMCMSLPLIGGVLTVKSWGQVPVHVLDVYKRQGIYPDRRSWCGQDRIYPGICERAWD